LTPEVVFADQRRRLLTATIEVLAEGGYRAVTVRGLSERAGVSTHTFYRQFANAADCIGFASETTMLGALRQMEEARLPTNDWEESFQAVITSLMQYFANSPEAAAVVLTEAFDAGPSVRLRLEAVIGTVAHLFAELLGASPRPITVPRRLSKGMVAGVLRIARQTSLAGRVDELPKLAPELSEWVLSLVAPARKAAFRTSAHARTGASPRREADPFPDGRGHRALLAAGDDRDRMIRATVRLAAADGFGNLTVTRIRRSAGVSRRSFNANFASVSECFLSSLELVVRSAVTWAKAWAESEADRDRRTTRLMTALCAQAARNGALASLVLVGVLDPGREGLLCRENLLDAGATRMGDELAPLMCDQAVALSASMAAAWEIAANETAAGRSSNLPALSPLLAKVVLAPLRSE
jgi:AcrR family transcriptional regulator